MVLLALIVLGSPITISVFLSGLSNTFNRFKVLRIVIVSASKSISSNLSPKSSPSRIPVYRLMIIPIPSLSPCTAVCNASCSFNDNTRISFLFCFGNVISSLTFLLTRPFLYACFKAECIILYIFFMVFSERPPFFVTSLFVTLSLILSHLPPLSFWLINF